MSLFPRVMAIVPFGIGLILLFTVWSGPFGEFDSRPLSFRLIGSFIAFFFMMIGVVFFQTGRALGDPRRMAQSLQQMTNELAANLPAAGAGTVEPTEETKPKVGYDCPNCGAALGKQADVSPSGDVKCGYCERWFNIHSVG